jgi:hypothetical protein
LSRSSFEKAYMTEMVKQGSDVVRLFQDEVKNGRVQSLKQLASSMLPGLQQRVTLAAETGSSVGAEVASPTRESQGSSGK